MNAAEVGFSVLVAAAVFAVVVGVRVAAERRRAAMERRLRGSGSESSISLSSVSLDPTNGRGTAGPLGRFDKWFDQAVGKSGMDASPIGVLAVMSLLAIVIGGGLYLWKEQIGLAILGVVIGFAVPLAVVAFLHRRYRAKLQNQIPDAYRMLAGSVRAGQTLEQAIEFYAAQGTKPLADEFANCATQMRLGMTPVAALKSVSDRLGLLDFDLLVSTVGLYTTTGGNLVQLLERLAESVRDRNQFRSQFMASTAQARAVSIALAAAAPIMLLVYALAEPEHVQTFFNTAGGWGILAMCAVLELVGVVWLWQILRIDV